MLQSVETAPERHERTGVLNETKPNNGNARRNRNVNAHWFIMAINSSADRSAEIALATSSAVGRTTDPADLSPSHSSDAARAVDALRESFDLEESGGTALSSSSWASGRGCRLGKSCAADRAVGSVEATRLVAVLLELVAVPSVPRMDTVWEEEAK